MRSKCQLALNKHGEQPPAFSESQFSNALTAHRYGDPQSLKRGVLATPYRYGDTFTADAIRLMRDYMFSSTLGDRPEVRNFGIIVTDGVSNIRNWRTIPEAHKAQVLNISFCRQRQYMPSAFDYSILCLIS